MSFTSPTEQFKSYQAFGSVSSSSKPAAQSFSSRVYFSDQSYDMPYFAYSGVFVSNPQTASTASKQSVADLPRGFTPKQLSDAPKTKSFDKKRLSSIPNISQKARPSQPPKAKIDYTEFLESLEFPSIADSKICQGSEDLITSHWLVQEALFTKWRASYGLLWLRGSEGSGKSTLMKQALESCQGPSSIHLTYSFFPSGDEARTRLGLFKSLLRQLVPQAPEAFKGIKERFDKIQSCLPPKQQVAWNAQELFDELIKVLPKILRTHSVFIYVDGLNYSEGETAPKLVQDFSKLVEKSQILTKDPTTTQGLRIIFSSTPYPMKDPFPRSCIQVDEKNGSSLRRHLEGQLSNIDLNTQRLVSTKAGSSFISARLIVNHIKLFGPGQSSLVQQPSPTPAPISFLLGAYFQDMAHQGSNGLFSLFKWCSLSLRPLSLPELWVALALDALPKVVSIKELSQTEYLTRFGSDESFQSWIETTSWGLLEVVTVGGEKVVKPMHDSVSDFFISEGLDILCYKAQSAVKLLLDRRADLRALDTYGNSVLHHAVNTEKSSVIKLLLDSGSDVNLQNAQGRTPLHLAIVGGHSSAIKALLERRSRTDIADNLGRRALHEAVLSGNKACTQLLLRHRVAVDAKDNDGQTALVYAIQGRHGSLLKLLLEGGTDINAMDKYGFTMIMVAVQASDEKLTRILLEKNPDLDRLSREGHTVAFYAVFRGKAVSFLSEEEQSIASLLFRRYQKRYQVWHPEWKECQQEFMAKHGKKKDASSNLKSKAKPSKVKSAPLPSKNDAAPKSRRSSKVPSNIVSKKLISASQPRADELKRPREAQGPPKPVPQNEVAGQSQSQSQPQIQSQNRPQATANTSAPLAPSNPVPKVSTGVQGNQMNTPSNSMAASGKPGMQQVRPVSSFASYQHPRVPSGSESGSAFDAKVKEQSSKPPQAPYPGGPSSTVPAKAPMVQRGSWDIYSSLASASPAPAQTVESQKAYVPYPGTPQTSPGASPASAQSLQTLQPFSAGQAQRTSSSTALVPLSQFEKRYSVPSLNSWGQPGSSGSASASPASRNTPAQPYQAFGAASQKPNMSQQQINAPYQKPANPVAAAKPPIPQVVRKPVGGKPVVPAEKPTQQSSFLPWQQPQASSGVKSPPVPMQAQTGTTQSWLSKPQAPPSTTHPTPRKQSASGPLPYLSSKASASSTGTSQPAPTKHQVHLVTAQAPPGKPQAQGGMPPRKPQAAPGLVQPQMTKSKGQAQNHPPSGKTASVPSKTHTPPGATQPQVAKPQVQPQAQIGKPAPVPPKSQTPTGAVQPQTAKPQAQNGKAEPQAHKMQGPPGTSQIPSGKPQGQGGLPSQKPQVPTSKIQSQPAKPSLQSGTSAQKQPAVPKSSVVAPAKPSATPAQIQKATPDQRKPISLHTGSGPQGAKSPTGIPVQGSSGQTPHQYIDKNSTVSPVPHYPEHFYRGQYGEQTQTSTFTSTREFTNSYDPNTQQTGTSSMSSSKMAAAAGVGVLAGAAGGYFLSSEIREDHSNPSITDDNSYIHMDAGMSQQPAYDSDGESETRVDFSDHSGEFSESENEANSINDSGSDGFVSDEEYELSDSEVSVGQASSDDEISEWGESDAESIHEDSDSDELDLDSPYISADFTDSEASEAEDLGARDLQAESGSDLDTDPGQASAEDSESEEKESVNNESEDELDESVQSMGFQQQSYIDQRYQQQGYSNEQYQQPIPEEPEYEEHVQPNFQPQYQQQGYFNDQYQQQVAQQSDSEEDEPRGDHQQYQQQGYYNQHNQVAQQTESEEDEPQNFQAQQQQQYQGYYGSHPQDQAPESSESDEEPYQQQYQQQGYHNEEGHQAAQGSVNYDSDQEVESDQEVNNGYSSDEQDQQATDGQYSGGGWGNNYDSDY
ncbi:hypothetical protein FNYG_11325 [Fusarium nygamai]|uniref:Nephrocystin 3-like N-terminal domain-containing protein n=1 Tax=Gibberella nygamai TaxID=42673 RepID=A0A2K0VYW7_GIBNY|nr:hypothetical protein FNYG_11325 [Fusarium nygamai]